MSTFLSIIQEYIRLGIPEQIDYKKFYLYSLITHSTAIEGSTVTEIENQSAEIAAFNASTEANDTKDDTKQLTDRQQIILDFIRKDDTITISQMIQNS